MRLWFCLVYELDGIRHTSFGTCTQDKFIKRLLDIYELGGEIISLTVEEINHVIKPKDS